MQEQKSSVLIGDQAFDVLLESVYLLLNGDYLGSILFSFPFGNFLRRNHEVFVSVINNIASIQDHRLAVDELVDILFSLEPNEGAVSLFVSLNAFDIPVCTKESSQGLLPVVGLGQVFYVQIVLPLSLHLIASMVSPRTHYSLFFLLLGLGRRSARGGRWRGNKNFPIRHPYYSPLGRNRLFDLLGLRLGSLFDFVFFFGQVGINVIKILFFLIPAHYV